MPQLSEELSALLDNDGSPEAAAQEVARWPHLVAQARDALPALRDVATHKAGEEGVSAVLGKRFVLYPQPQRSDAEWAAWWSEYFALLSDLPLASLEAGMRAWVASPDSEFLPKPGKLRELAQITPCLSLRRYHRAKRALALVEAEQAKRDPADPQAVRRMLDEFRAGTLKREDSPRGAAPMPDIGGVPDETGVTPQMRALLERQRNS
jgi:hypothetical protein